MDYRYGQDPQTSKEDGLCMKQAHLWQQEYCKDASIF